VLDKLGTIDGGDQEFGFCGPGAGSVVHRAAETLLENRTVDFAEFRGSGGILDAGQRCGRGEKIINSGCLAKKFGVGGNRDVSRCCFGIAERAR